MGDELTLSGWAARRGNNYARWQDHPKPVRTMIQPIVSFSRKFQVWSYSVSHAQLLIRSTKNSQYPTQVDVLFKNVNGVLLPTFFDGLTITEAACSEFEGFRETLPKSSKCFKLEGTNWHGAVAAGVVVWNESEAEYYDESTLLS
jgi:hypothetical protein